jgi:ribonuclease R
LFTAQFAFNFKSHLMEFSIAQLLDNFSDDKLVAPKAIEKKLGISDDNTNTRKLQVALDALEKVGIVEKDKGKYRRISEDGLVEGRLRCSSKGFCFAIQDAEGAEDIYIRESRLSNAWNGDRVLVRVTKDGIRRRSPEGEVRLILERSNLTLLSTVKATDAGYRAIPLDDRLLFEIELMPDEETPDLSLSVGKLVHLEMVRYSLGSHLPVARIAQILGEDAESTDDIDLVCCKHNLPRRFGAKAMSAAASLPRGVRKADLKHRLDLRKIVAVKLANTPAISISANESGWDLGVHIPDVSAYISPGSPMDLEARKRVRAYFLGDVVLPMLPEMHVLDQLEHLTMSVMLKLDRDGALVSFEIQPSAVSVRTNLSYKKAQNLLDGENDSSEDEDPEVKKLLGQISELGLLLQQRSDGFHLVLPQPPSQEVDEGVIGVPVVPVALPIYGMVTEMMVLANKAIASHLHAFSLPTPYRVQTSPDVSKVIDWLKLLDSMGITYALSDAEQVHPKDLHYLLTQIAQLEPITSREILQYLLLSMFKPCEYSLKPGLHFGLALPETTPYVQGVAPQHRYADLLVQRSLHLIFQEGRDRRSSRIKDGINLKSSTCHGQVNWSVLPPEVERQLQEDLEVILPKLTAHDALFQKASSDLEGLRKAEYMRVRIGDTFFGVITSVQSYGFFVEIESLLVEGLVHVSSLKDDWYEFPQNNGRGKSRASTVLVGRRSGRQYSLGDRVEVQVKGVDYYRQQVDLVAVVSVENEQEGDNSAPVEISEEFEQDDSDTSNDFEAE